MKSRIPMGEAKILFSLELDNFVIVFKEVHDFSGSFKEGSFSLKDIGLPSEILISVCAPKNAYFQTSFCRRSFDSPSSMGVKFSILTVIL